ncbi:hypothetical protein SCHPADRAFT_840702 [Schizopora paradoxa]|uniref:HAT C-terminal dimerisation domain-containing protein n=1 Tax=Schizopora paradoxa TaxID=27342 RepID=A0A0H2QXM8_9AGAM|nr:hypothetical protein SCHPADRAFT_840702 [Schizopora paradoxa]
MHPQYKTSYFSEQDWPEDWIATARGILRDEWNDYYKPDTHPATRPTVSTPTPAPTKASKAELFAAISKRRTAAPKPTDVESYIYEEPVMNEFTDDPIAYWFTKRTDPFARMGLDFMSAPGTSPFLTSQGLMSHVQSFLSYISRRRARFLSR